MPIEPIPDCFLCPPSAFLPYSAPITIMTTSDSHNDSDERIRELEARVVQLEKELHEARLRAWDPLERAMFRSLMEQIPDAIYFKDVDSHFLRVSRHMALKHTNDGNPRAMIGKTDDDYYKPEHADLAREMEKEIISSSTPVINEHEHEIWQNGKDTWCSTTKLPLRDSDGNIIGTFGISRDITKWKNIELEKDELIDKLSDALAKIDELGGLLPICSNCKKIRDPKGDWHILENYISSHSDARFTHSICDTCTPELYPELNLEPPKET